MNIAVSTVYGEVYIKDRLFDSSSCKIGENLLMPGIELKKRLEEEGHSYHTADMYRMKDIDIIFFQDIPVDSILTIDNPVDFLKYLLKRKWRRDYLLKAILYIPKQRRILQISEPPTVALNSYKMKFHRYFQKVLTWDDDLADGKRYIKYFIPQCMPSKAFCVPFQRKKILTMIAGNKVSANKKELYSKRREVIDFFESADNVFDLYGFGWEKEGIRNYKGTVDSKLETLSQYKFCISFENMSNINGYITEKIFDCFFAGCIPIYWGAENIDQYIPADTYIDMRKFETVDDMFQHIQRIDETEYNKYLQATREYLKSRKYKETFDTSQYIKEIMGVINEYEG